MFGQVGGGVHELESSFREIVRERSEEVRRSAVESQLPVPEIECVEVRKFPEHLDLESSAVHDALADPADQHRILASRPTGGPDPSARTQEAHLSKIVASIREIPVVETTHSEAEHPVPSSAGPFGAETGEFTLTGDDRGGRQGGYSCGRDSGGISSDWS